MLRRTFQHIKNVGPWREKDLWARGILTWDDFPAEGAGIAISAAVDDEARLKIREAREALERRDLATLARLLPPREHWRLYREFKDQAVFFDIETDGRPRLTPTVVSLFDRRGLRVFIDGRNMDELPAALAESPIWVSFNGSVFDVPVLQRHFPNLVDPTVHLDLRFLCRRVGLNGGLKEIEETLGMNRPKHLWGMNGWDAVLLWRVYQREANVEALRFLVEYNLHDSFHLRTVLESAYNRVLDELAPDVPRQPVFDRGDILYDVSKLILALGPTERDMRVLEQIRAQDRQIREQAADAVIPDDP